MEVCDHPLNTPGENSVEGYPVTHVAHVGWCKPLKGNAYSFIDYSLPTYSLYKIFTLWAVPPYPCFFCCKYYFICRLVAFWARYIREVVWHRCSLLVFCWLVSALIACRLGGVVVLHCCFVATVARLSAISWQHLGILK